MKRCPRNKYKYTNYTLKTLLTEQKGISLFIFKSRKDKKPGKSKNSNSGTSKKSGRSQKSVRNKSGRSKSGINKSGRSKRLSCFE